MLLATALSVVAIVGQDATALRAAPRDSAPQQAVLWQGDSLEIRGEKGDFLQVYDYRRERAGYVRASQVRTQSLKEEAAPELLTLVRFLRDSPGSEALGISYAATYLSVNAGAVRRGEEAGGEVLEALASMADRLARRAASGVSGRAGEILAAHLEVAGAYGVAFNSYMRDGRVQLCYEGSAARQVLALPAATPLQKAQAALILTRHECVAPDLSPLARFQLDTWRAEVLDRIDLKALPEVLKNRVRMRRAGVWAGLAYQRARRPELDTAAVGSAARRALDELAAINKAELMENDQPAYADAGLRVGASRWGAEPAPGTPSSPLHIRLSPGRPGETCVQLWDTRQDNTRPQLNRCTWGVVWAASASSHPDGSALSLAVQPLESWRELWLFRKGSEGWQLDVLPPGLDDPQLGYLEFAGWVPNTHQFLAAREIRQEGRYQTRFELINRDSLATDKQADRPANLSAFYRWQSPAWKAGTVSVR